MPIPKIVVTVALMAAQTALQMTQKVRGPRLDDLKTTTAEYGTPIPRFWGKRKFNCPVIWAADLIETRHTSKGKAGKNTQYKYFADFAILICDHEIDAVTRIWMDEKLVYQTTDIGPTSVGAAAGLTVGGNMRVYLGTETQDADPLMEAWCDDRYGANSCPAYRGSSYIVFERLPVNNFGNRIPNITVEAVTSAAAIYPFEQLTVAMSMRGSFSPDFTKLYLGGGGGGGFGFQIWDVPTRTLLIQSATAAGALHLAVNADGTFYGQNSSHTCLFTEGGSATQICGGMEGVWNTSIGIAGTPGLVSNHILVPGADVDSTDQIATNFHPKWFFDDEDGVSWAVGGQSSSGSYTTGFGLYNLSDGTEHLVACATSGPAYGFAAPNGQFFIRQDNKIYLVDSSTFAITAGPVSAVNAADEQPFWAPVAGDDSIWIGFKKYSATDLSVLETFSSGSWGTGTSAANGAYDKINDAIWTQGILDPGTTIRFLHRVGSNGVTLGTFMPDISDWYALAA
jgi:hypothetical protein